MKPSKDWDGAMNIETNQNRGIKSQFNLASQMIRALYPNADIVGEKTKSRTGLLEISVTRSDGQEKLIHSKKNGDGGFKKTNAPEILQKLKDFVEAKQKHHKINNKEQHQNQKGAADEDQFEHSKSKEIIININSKKKQIQEEEEPNNYVKVKKQLSKEQLEEIEQLIKHHNVKLAERQKKEIDDMIRKAHMKQQNESNSDQQKMNENSRRSMQTRSKQKYLEDSD